MVSDALSREMNSLVCASDGNLGASLSAYCAAAQLNCYCVVPKNTSPEKRTQMLAYGADIVDYGNTIDDSLDLAKKMIEKGRYQATPEFNILTVEGAKTISFEIIDQLNSSETFEQIDFIVVPMGSGSLLYSIWKGFKQAKEFKLVDAKFKLPKIIGVQADG
ncbi:MAG: pyridoxal-phosphate dependent enzyme, partial [Candidatus Heimdallarchaeota archaeon]